MMPFASANLSVAPVGRHFFLGGDRRPSLDTEECQLRDLLSAGNGFAHQTKVLAISYSYTNVRGRAARRTPPLYSWKEPRPRWRRVAITAIVATEIERARADCDVVLTNIGCRTASLNGSRTY